ncbi:MAG: Lsr2 family protein [Bowdeniella nasicola]|nr:Lsr2 family protein [Bowdeniella nasicola]
MAKRVHIQLVDDLDGSDAVETVHFGLDGVSYEIDLNEENVNALRGALAPWIEKARREPGQRATRRTAGGKKGKRTQSDSARIRAWAIENNIPVSDRGRIPADLRERYYRENPSG